MKQWPTRTPPKFGGEARYPRMDTIPISDNTPAVLLTLSSPIKVVPMIKERTNVRKRANIHCGLRMR